MTNKQRAQVVELLRCGLPERFWAKVSHRSETDCWCWTGASVPQPKFWSNGNLDSALRVALRAFGVVVPDCHYAAPVCGERLCVNPAHAVVRPLSELRSATNHRPSWKTRLETKLAAPNERGCIEFTGQRDDDGYGVLRSRRGQREHKAHRIAWQLANGEIPDGMVVMHKCDNPPCCNVEHLQLGTVADNNRDREAKGRTRGLVPGGKPAARVEEKSWP